MKIFENKKTDAVAEKDGVWVWYGEEAWVKVARAGGANKRFTRVSQQLSKERRRQKNDDEELNKIMARLVSETILMGWKGFEDLEAFSKEYAFDVLCELPDFRRDIERIAEDEKIFNKAELEAAAKNSEAPSAGQSSGAEKTEKKSSK